MSSPISINIGNNIIVCTETEGNVSITGCKQAKISSKGSGVTSWTVGDIIVYLLDVAQPAYLDNGIRYLLVDQSNILFSYTPPVSP